MSGRRKFRSMKRPIKAKKFQGTPAWSQKPSPVVSYSPPASTPSFSYPPPSQPSCSDPPTLQASTPSTSAAPHASASAVPGSLPISAPISRSSKKIALAREASGGSSSQSVEDNWFDYHFIRFSNLAKALKAFTCCCSPLTLTEDRSRRRGFVCKLEICCSVCGKSSNITNPYNTEVNSRSVLAARAIGKGRADLATFAGMMGIPPPVANINFVYHEERLAKATEVVKQQNSARMLRRMRWWIAK